VSVIDPALIADGRRLLNAARVIAEAPAGREPDLPPPEPGSSLQRKARPHPKGESAVPPGVWGLEISTLEECGAAINAAIAHDSDVELEAALAWGNAELDALQHGVPNRREETIAERGARICANYEGVLAGVVARQERMSVTQVRDIRAAGGRDPRTGHKRGRQPLAGAQ